MSFLVITPNVHLLGHLSALMLYVHTALTFVPLLLNLSPESPFPKNSSFLLSSILLLPSP